MRVEIVFEDGADLVPLVLDAAPEERHRASSIATENEVEEGVAITDHVRPERRTLTLDVVISDTPIEATAAVTLLQNAVDVDLGEQIQRISDATLDGETWRPAEYDAKASSAQLAVLQPAEPTTRVVDAWRQIIDARDRVLRATVTTKIETYESMVLIEAIVNRTAEDGTWLRAELTFAEIRDVATEFVVDEVALRPRDRPEGNNGSQEGTAIEGADLTSVWAQAIDAGGPGAVLESLQDTLFGGGG
ncbi:MAG: phage baseplate protein [Acidobacteriota bacterium]